MELDSIPVSWQRSLYVCSFYLSFQPKNLKNYLTFHSFYFLPFHKSSTPFMFPWRCLHAKPCHCEVQTKIPTRYQVQPHSPQNKKCVITLTHIFLHNQTPHTTVMHTQPITAAIEVGPSFPLEHNCIITPKLDFIFINPESKCGYINRGQAQIMGRKKSNNNSINQYFNFQQDLESSKINAHWCMHIQNIHTIYIAI